MGDPNLRQGAWIELTTDAFPFGCRHQIADRFGYQVHERAGGSMFMPKSG